MTGIEPQTRPKGVMFSDTAAKPAPIRQVSQTSSKMGMSMPPAMSSATIPKPKPSTATVPAKPVVKKPTTDMGKGAVAANASRKSSQGAKKEATKVSQSYRTAK